MRIKWSDNLLAAEIRKYSDGVHMPNSKDLRLSEQNRLVCAISRHPLKWRWWASRLGLALKRSNTQRSYEQEQNIASMLRRTGHTASLTPAKCPHDILVDGAVRVEVKIARKFLKQGHIFCFGRADREFDFAVLVCVDASDHPIRTLILPASRCRQQTITVTNAEQWCQWDDRWDLLEVETDQ